MMLNPNDRALYTAALTPPIGMVFGEAIATTYSLDPTTLLAVPAHLALADCRGCDDQITDGITLLESLKRVSMKITVFAERGRIQVPTIPHVLYSLLEPLIVEVAAPRGGAFHPKLWLLRFTHPDGQGTPLLRLIVLSRNLTADRSWDISLHLEGRPGGRYRAENRELGEFVNTLPTLAERARAEMEVIKDRAGRLSDELRRTEWELPLGFESVRFYVHGFKKRNSWQPPGSDKAVLISPFCTDQALAHLVVGCRAPTALISNADTLSGLDQETLKLFKDCYCLQEAAETEDGEDATETYQRDAQGLHAKVYVYNRGWNAHVVVGSANATNAALLSGNNVEVLAELVGRKSKTIDIDKLLSNDGLGEYIASFSWQDPPVADQERKDAEKALEEARGVLIKAGLRLKCQAAEDSEAWALSISGYLPAPFEGVAEIKAWPISMRPDSARNILGGLQKGEVSLGTFSSQSITGLIAFELASTLANLQLRFVINLPLDGQLPDRDAAIIRTVINNREGFLRYLLLLLGGDYDNSVPDAGAGLAHDKKWAWAGGLTLDAPLLEQLTRAFSRHPERLGEVRDLVRKLATEDSEQQIIPKGFIELWQVFEKALGDRHG